MKITRIKANNFLSYPELDCEFSNGLVLLDGFNFDQNSANGVGKTALIDACMFALFGKTARDIKIDEHIMRGAGSMACSVDLEDSGKCVKITRQRNPNQVLFEIDGNTTTAQDLNDFQIKINKYLGCDYSLFLNSVYFAQSKSGQFLLASDEGKKQVLLDVLNLDQFNISYEAVKEDLKKNEANRARQQVTLDSKTEALTGCDTRVKRYKELCGNFEIDKGERLENAEAEYKEVVASIEGLKEQLETTSYDVGGYQERHARYIKAIENSDKLKIAIKEQVKMFAEVNRIKEKIAESKERLRVFHTGICPTCKQNLPVASDVVCVETKAKKEQTDALQAKTEMCQKLESFVALNSKAIEKELLDSKGELEKYTGMKDKVDLINKQLGDYHKRIKALEELKENIKDSKNEYDILLNQEVAHREKVQAEAEAAKKAIGELEEIGAYLEALKDIFGPQGVRSVILDASINNLNQLSNGYLRELFDAPVSIQFSIDHVETKSAYKQRVHTVVLMDGVEVSLDSLSGGEKRRVIIATDLALADLVASRSSKGFNMMFLDEVSEGLDAAGREKLFTLLSRISKKSSVISVDHASEFKSMFDKTIYIEKRNGKSRIK